MEPAGGVVVGARPWTVSGQPLLPSGGWYPQQEASKDRNRYSTVETGTVLEACWGENLAGYLALNMRGITREPELE